ncbi:hypothetical protein N5P37_011768 [Trichoderma harzianum]|uniref:RNase H type-1 domain-containing protein n=1 Tax=Trichoderma harzianum CBS 226.95 TaxID=983964 RepID=A0A2T3ZR80_TRIHA|nr:hypothetical protein M431DRAFT_488651 [Trichoderma harzianum CBS 226.95]KAK0755682.1 hypothetical protein N5P37_011768 [Trichoderma harzianum]PTB47310.1 hypothetical protein M431DRAFT_488651 [Trichoderma harzianum CBS 226.95]
MFFSTSNFGVHRVYDAEAVGAFEAIKLAKLRIADTPDINELVLFLDKSAVVDGILGTTSASSQGAYMGIRRIAKVIQSRFTPELRGSRDKDIYDNETADALAKGVQEFQDPPKSLHHKPHKEKGASQRSLHAPEL